MAKNAQAFIRLSGLRENNLKDIDVAIPIGAITVIVGPSGSGKSTLAMDVLYAEGQYRYLESLSPEAKALIGQRKRPAHSSIQGIPPPIAISQILPRRSIRSNVASITELSNLLKVLFSTCGKIYCPRCQRQLSALTIDQIVDRIMDLPEGSRIHVLAPIRPPYNDLKGLARDILSQGFIRVRIDGNVVPTEYLEEEKIAPKAIEIVVDRLVIRRGILSRLSESVALCLKISQGKILIELPDKRAEDKSVLTFSDRLICPVCDEVVPEPSPSIFSKAVTNQDGKRFQSYKKAIRILDKDFDSVTSLDLVSIKAFLESAQKASLRQDERAIRNPKAALSILDAIFSKLSPLLQMDLGYLQLDRSIVTLSSGELQRLRLASQLGKGLTGILYILDEPTAGLSPSQQEPLWHTLTRLKAMGCTIVMVEHRPSWIRRADYVIELGPGSGSRGGEILYQGPSFGITRAKGSVTARFLNKKARHFSRYRLRPLSMSEPLSIELPIINNLRCSSITFPRSCLIAVTGPSGSGKSSLLLAIETALSTQKKPQRPVLVDQSPIYGSTASTPATYLGIFTRIRGLFARVPDARARGFGAGFFSLNKKGGRCELCKGRGYIFLDLKYLPSVQMTCELCQGKRFNRDALSIRYKGLTISEVLDLTVDEAIEVFKKIPGIRNPLEVLQRTGLGYLKLGQHTDTLSGGENQRLKLAKELTRPVEHKSFYLLDEPTKGLHPTDIENLIKVLDELLDKGHTVIIASSLTELVQVCDWVIEMGPGSGPKGGQIVGQYRPRDYEQN